MKDYQVFCVWYIHDYFYCVVFAKDKSHAKQKAIKRMLKINNIKTNARDWEIEEFTPKTHGGCWSFD